ncbi:MAG TPA: DUF4097 family beta strand repeat-containing protein [Candidatus Limnocylindrales bacterium]|nr:DUF4097 family beta strand repeat-containing protein [Candidatus Limnocylindrales bacterium]
MTDTASASPSVRELPLAPGGAVELHLTANDIRIHGTDANVVRIAARGGEDLDDEIVIDAEDDHVVIRNVEGGFRVGRVLIPGPGPATLDIDVPRSARLTSKTLSGDVEADGIRGESRWSTASGDLRLRVTGGSVTADSMSGDVTIEADASVGVRVHSVSGDVRLAAPHLDALDVSSTSGDIRVAAAFGPGFGHTISSVSGDVHLRSSSPIRLDTQTIAGDVRATGAHHAEGGRGRRTIVVGDGSIRLGVRTTSGDIRLQPDEDGRDGRSPLAPRVAPVTPPTAPAPPAPPVTPAVPVPPIVEPPESWVVADAQAAPNLVRHTPLDDTDHPGDGDGASSGAESDVDRREGARLDILRALERGELDVAAASHRLEQLDEAGPRYFRGFC